jgi:membrane protease YdiL (CAAX protease family)
VSGAAQGRAGGPGGPSALGLALALAAALAWLVAAAAARRLGIWPSLGGTALALGAAVLAVDHTVRTGLRPTPVRILIGAAAGATLAAATHLAYPLLAHLEPWIARDTALLYAAFRAPPGRWASLALAPIIFGEELVWRGAVQGALSRRLGRTAGVILAALGYALVLVPLGSPVLPLVAGGCGLVWGVLRAATRSLVPPVVAHLAWDLLVLLWLPLG